MGSRTIVYCDYCMMDSPSGSAISDGWVVDPHSRLMLCRDCHNEQTKAIADAKKRCEERGAKG